MIDVNTIPRMCVGDALKTIFEHSLLFYPYRAELTKFEQESHPDVLTEIVSSGNSRSNRAAVEFAKTGRLKPDLPLPEMFALLTRLTLAYEHMSTQPDDQKLLLATFDVEKDDFVPYSDVISFVLLGIKPEISSPYLYVS